MDRLNFRKKMAVFISFVMILQVVLCNVGFAVEAPSIKVCVVGLKDGENYCGTVSYRIKKSGEANFGDTVTIADDAYTQNTGEQSYTCSPSIDG